MKDRRYEVREWTFAEVPIPKYPKVIRVRSDQNKIVFTGVQHTYCHNPEKLEEFAQALLEAVRQFREWREGPAQSEVE